MIREIRGQKLRVIGGGEKVRLVGGGARLWGMATTRPPAPRDVIVREVPIELCQFIKFGGLADSGGAAKQMVADGEVVVNGAPETRKRKQLLAGDKVTVAGQTIIVRLS